MKIVIPDGYSLNPGDLSWSAFDQFSDFTVYDNTPDHLLKERLADADIVLVKKTPLTKELLDACPRIRYIGILAPGYDFFDLEAVKGRGITVTNTPGFGSEAVAQYVFALLLELCHHVGHHGDTVIRGRWQKGGMTFNYWDYPLTELVGKTMGVVGFGGIGKAVARIASGFGMKVLVYDKYGTDEPADQNIRRVTFDELLSHADIISLNCPLTEDNRNMIDSGAIARMKDGVIILNTARGGLINEAALAAALKSGKVRGAGLDVLADEPPGDDHILVGAANCIITPHIAGAPLETRARLMDIAAENLRAYLEGRPVNVVSGPTAE